MALPFTILSSPDRVRLVAGEDFRYTLDGAELDTWLPQWLPALDGRRTLAQALEMLATDRRDVAREIVARLYGERVLIDAPASAAYSPEPYSLSVEGEGLLHEQLTSYCQSTSGTGGRLLPVLCQDRLDYDMALRFNRCRLNSDAPWLWTSCAAMSRAYVSPLFLPDAGPCLECLLNHFQRRSPMPELYTDLIVYARQGGSIQPTPTPVRAIALLAQLVLWKAELAREADAPAALFRLHVLDVATLEVASHRVFADPECRAMRRSEMTAPWYANPYTGLFSRCGPVSRRAHDPAVSIWAGTLPRWGLDGTDLATGGAGWSAESAEAAGVGEGIERWQCKPSPQDHTVTASYESWPLDEQTIEPRLWVLFHPAQYAQPAFPFQPFTPQSVVRWVCCREGGSGRPWWVPEEFVFLQPPAGGRHHLGPAISTGLSCGRSGDPVLLRGLQEAIERDALMGAWWGRYVLEEHELPHVLAVLPPELPPRLRRPNLRYRCYRIVSPFSSHVTVVTLEGEDHEGWCFSVGSACRETRAASWQKAFLEAVQGRHFVRYLKARGQDHLESGAPVDFVGHALYYSLRPERLRSTVLERTITVASSTDGCGTEGWQVLADHLGADRPVLFRHVTPPALLAEELGWIVLRVLVPGLQPMHGHHGYPFLGGPLWAPRRGGMAIHPPSSFPLSIEG